MDDPRFMNIQPREELVPNRMALLLLLGVGFTATVGQLFLTKAYAEGSLSNVSVVGLTKVLFGMALEQLWAPRVYGARTISGIVLVLALTGWMLWRGQRKDPVAPARQHLVRD